MNECEYCGRQFMTVKGLKIHQSRSGHAYLITK